MTRIYFTRHGETLWNKEGRFQGGKDSALTGKGIKQAQWLGERMNEVRIDLIFSSTSLRAYHTAEIIRGTREIDIIRCEELKEISLGEWEGMLFSEIESKYPLEYERFWHRPDEYVPVGGERFDELMKRASEKFIEIAETNFGKNLLIVTHGVVLKSLLTYFEKKDIKDFWTGAYMNSTCLNLVEYKDGEFCLVFQGDVSHYQPDEHFE